MDMQCTTTAAGDGARAFAEYSADIEREHATLGHTRGWRFLCVPPAVLDAPVDIALVMLNPPGDHGAADQPAPQCEKGPGHFAEPWGAPVRGRHRLQVQVQQLFAGLHQRLQVADSGELLMQRSLVGYFVPFRAPRFADLPRQIASFTFGRNLWQRVLARTRPRLTLCIDRETHTELQSIIPAFTGMTPHSACSYPTGWGRCSADLMTFGPAREFRLLRLPNLANFPLFSNPNCLQRLNRVLDDACNGLLPRT
jgi:hypothetical protein